MDKREAALNISMPSLIPVVSIARLSVVKQSFFGLSGQYGRRVTRVNRVSVMET